MARRYMQDPYDRAIISARGLSGRVNHDDMLSALPLAVLPETEC